MENYGTQRIKWRVLAYDLFATDHQITPLSLRAIKRSFA